MQAWRTAVSASQQLADEFAHWTLKPDVSTLKAL
jgi:hypothetical protein